MKKLKPMQSETTPRARSTAPGRPKTAAFPSVGEIVPRALGLIALGVAAASGCGGTSSSNTTVNDAGQAGEGEGPRGGRAGTSGGGGSAGGSLVGGAPGVDDGGEGGGAGETYQGGEAGEASAGVSAGGFAGQGTGGIGGTGGVAGDGGAAGAISTGTGQVGTLGEQCAAPGSLACAGNHQKVTLICSQFGIWQHNETCDAGEFCNSTPSENAGVCSAPAEECADRSPLELFCDGPNVRQCDSDGLASALEAECSYQCVAGACDDGCRDNMLMDCSELCGGPRNCDEVCARGLADASPPPLLVPSGEIQPGVPYMLRMGPVVEPLDSNLYCEHRCPSIVGHALQAFAFLLPENEEFPLWRFTTEGPWQALLASWPDQRDLCHEETPPALLASLADEIECLVTSVPYTQASVLWLYAVGPYDAPATITLEMGNAETLADGCSGL